MGIWGTAACLVVGLILFVTSMAPALAEREALEQVRSDLHHDLRQLRNLLRAFESRGLDRGGVDAPEDDLQAILVAIDALGHTPAELLSLFPGDAEGR